MTGSNLTASPADASRVFSGIQPTGSKHLGNYLGAIRQYVASQEYGQAIFCVVDLHAMTVAYEPAELPERVLDTTALLLAAGLDPKRCLLFRQSDVREHSELALLLANLTSYGDLQRMTQFKDKSAQLTARALIPTGLFTYPVLQAADILLYHTTVVPVGEDQRQHLELARAIARNFNARFGGVFTIPEQRTPTLAARVMDLQDPTHKMSTTSPSPDGTIYMLDDEQAILKKFRRAVTDPENVVRFAPSQPGISNLIEILAAVRGSDHASVVAEFAGGGYGALKDACGREVAATLAPIAARYLRLRADRAALAAVLASGAASARAIAAATMAEVRERMGAGTL